MASALEAELAIAALGFLEGADELLSARDFYGIRLPQREGIYGPS